MRITLYTTDLSDETLVDIANGLSHDINTPERKAEWLAIAFNRVCNEIKSRGMVVADHVVCPE